MKSEGDDRAALPAPDLEPDTGDAPVAAQETPRFDSSVHVRVVSYRKRLTDTDGISVKAALDAIVRAGILADDSAKQVKSITFENRKSKEERTLIILDDSHVPENN